MSIVTSYFPGRIRFRAPFLRDRDLRNALISAIGELGFSGKYTVNESTGSVLVEYDTAQITGDILETLRPMAAAVAPLRTKAEYYSSRDKDFLLSEIERLKEEAKRRLDG